MTKIDNIDPFLDAGVYEATTHIQVWKKVPHGVLECIIPKGSTIVVPYHAETNVIDLSKKMRTDCLVPLYKFDLSDFDIDFNSAFSCFYDFEYKIGVPAFPTYKLSEDLRNDCDTGLHFFATPDAARWY